jgi:hypothetical protein
MIYHLHFERRVSGHADPGTIQLERGTASGRAYMSELGRFRHGISQLNYAVYRDGHYCTQDGWKFAERVHKVKYLDTTPLAGSAHHAAGVLANPPTENKSSTKGRR